LTAAQLGDSGFFAVVFVADVVCFVIGAVFGSFCRSYTSIRYDGFAGVESGFGAAQFTEQQTAAPVPVAQGGAVDKNRLETRNVTATMALPATPCE
jgi:hypothetical protein